MTYAPPWPGWADLTHTAIAEALADLDPDQAKLARTVGAIIGDDLRGEFVDVDPDIVAWVAMRTATHLGGIAREADADGPTLALVGMLAGQHVQAGEA
ncbi:hypothetical protein AB0I81_22470 [Nonomuraea sp. NPDC050404]|uniref:hypothetical protein n=1 Tax=Nonomuraea sp. NPDC050404 TaxID=3155783 RepID=UPI003403681F